jgi:hypothetical protein
LTGNRDRENHAENRLNDRDDVRGSLSMDSRGGARFGAFVEGNVWNGVARSPFCENGALDSWEFEAVNFMFKTAETGDGIRPGREDVSVRSTNGPR